jgi:hemolysin activation/secretion protein
VLPAQALWRLGGATTLRGYPPSSLVGERYWRGRAELGWGFPASRLVVFSDWAWAGPRNRFDTTGAASSLGVGVNIFDGLFGFDVAKGLQAPGGWRVHLRLGGAW